MAGFFLSRLGHAHRVGAHVGDEAYPLTGTDVLALIESLGDGHGLFGRKAQPSAAFLLKSAGPKRRRRLPAPLTLGYLVYNIDRAFKIVDDTLGFGLVLKVGVLAPDFDQFCDEGLGLLFVRGVLLLEFCFNGPILNWYECLDLSLALTDQAQCH